MSYTISILKDEDNADTLAGFTRWTIGSIAMIETLSIIGQL